MTNKCDFQYICKTTGKIACAILRTKLKEEDIDCEFECRLNKHPDISKEDCGTRIAYSRFGIQYAPRGTYRTQEGVIF